MRLLYTHALAMRDLGQPTGVRLMEVNDRAFRFDQLVTARQTHRVLEELSRSPPLFFCLNDDFATPAEAADAARIMVAGLNRLFPDPAEWELFQDDIPAEAQPSPQEGQATAPGL